MYTVVNVSYLSRGMSLAVCKCLSLYNVWQFEVEEFHCPFSLVIIVKCYEFLKSALLNKGHCRNYKKERTINSKCHIHSQVNVVLIELRV